MIPELGIITVCLNAEKSIQHTIESVLNQTIPPKEYVIVDGHSEDRTLAIIQSYAEPFRSKGIAYKWISEKDSGIYEAFNKGLGISTTPWVSFLGADDIYKPRAIEIYIKNWPKESADIVYSQIEDFENAQAGKSWSWSSFKKRMTIPHIGAFHNKSYFEQYGLFDTTYKIAGDYELLLRAKKKLKAHVVNEVTVVMGHEGVSNKYVKEVYSETTRAKIETARLSWIMSKIDYCIWLIKFRIKKLFHALA